MPITPKYQWRETDTDVEVVVELTGVSKSASDVFATDCMLKVNTPPYLLLLDLHGFVEDTKSAATITPAGVTFSLKKKEPGLWGKLLVEGAKDDVARRRNDSVERAHQRIEEARKARQALKEKEKRDATDRQLDLDRRKRGEIERRKAEELQGERDRLVTWQQQVSRGEDGDESDYEEEEEEEEEEEAAEKQQVGAEAAARGGSGGGGEERPMSDHPDYHGRGWRPSKAQQGQGKQQHGAGRAGAADSSGDDDDGRSLAAAAAGRLDADGDDDDDGGSSDDEAGRRRQAAAAAPPPAAAAAAKPFRPLPPPRVRLTSVPVEFTRLETDHLPARQNREAEIREYKAKSRSAGLLAESADVADRQPLFLKDKGDGLFRQGNYRGAANAYSRALELDPSGLVSVWSNRAACRLKLGEPAEAEADCDAGLELVGQRRARFNARAMAADEEAEFVRLTVRLHVRRGQARVEVGRHADALADYEAALALDPANEALVRDRDELAACLQPADAAALRQRGEARFRAGDAEGGYEAFSALLRLAAAAAASGAATAPAVSAADRLAALSNRAACAIVLERYGQAVADCDAALQLVLPECGCAGGVDAVHQWAARLGDTGAGSAEEASTTCQAVDSSSSSLPDGGKLRSAVRLLTRRGAARSYTKDYSAAIADYGAAAALLRAVGEGEKAAEVAADMSALQRLAAVGSSRGETDAAAAAAAAVPAAAAAAAGVVASS